VTPTRRRLCWILILVTLCKLPAAHANAPHPQNPSFRTRNPPSTQHTPITPIRPRTSSPNHSRPPATFRTDDNPDNHNHGDSLDDYLSLLDHGKAYQEVDPGQGPTPDSVWKEQTMRIYFQNINGIRLENEGADSIDLFLQMENIRADVFAFAETKLATDQPYVQKLLQQNKRKIWDHACLITSTSKVVLEGYHKPGGTLTCATNSLVGRIRRTFSDPYGRWSGIELMGRSTKRLVILTVYQVPQKSGTSGNTTAYTQQRNMFRLEGRINPNPRKILIHDLKALVTELR
jgi:hypothetical protein